MIRKQWSFIRTAPIICAAVESAFHLTSWKLDQGLSVMGADCHILRARAEARRTVRSHRADVDWDRGRGDREKEPDLRNIRSDLLEMKSASLFPELKHRELDLCWAFELGQCL